MNCRFFLLLPFLLSAPLKAQADFWLATGGPTGTRVSGITLTSEGSLFAGTIGDGVFRSTDEGNSWIPVNNGLASLDIHTICTAPGDRLYTGTSSGSVYYSDDLGETWTITSSTGIADVYAVGQTPDGKVFASGAGGICRSTNNGSTWDQLDVGMPQIMIWSTVIVLDENTLITGSLGMGAIRSTDAGTTWSQVFPGPPDNIVYSFVNDESNGIFAATGMGIYKSLDEGMTWSEVPDPENSNVSLFVIDPSARYVAVTSSGVSVSTNGGTLWTEASSGLGDLSILSLAVAEDGTIYAGTDGGGVYVNSVVTSVEGSESVPEGYILKQNYPNPFNPGTTISFEIQKEGFVTLGIYDILGKEVTVLVNERLGPGSYTRYWDASGQATGIFHYRMSVGTDAETKSMVLIR